MGRDRTNYTHGDTGTKPASALDFEENQRPDAQQFDWWWYTVSAAIDSHADEFDRLDADDDGIVDEAGYADNADKVDGQHYSDIQYWVNNNADVPNADHADNADDADTVDGKHANQVTPSVSDSGTVVESAPSDINTTGEISATSDGDGTVTLDSSPNVENVSVDDSGTAVSEDPLRIDFDNALNVSESSGTADVDVNESAINAGSVNSISLKYEETDWIVIRSGDRVNLTFGSNAPEPQYNTIFSTVVYVRDPNGSGYIKATHRGDTVHGINWWVEDGNSDHVVRCEADSTEDKEVKAYVLYE